MKMKKKIFFRLLAMLPLQALLACAPAVSPKLNSPPIPLDKVNLKVVLEEQEGLEILREDVKDIRDFYRGGVQHKARAEEKFQKKAFSEALKLYDSSNDFLLDVVQYMDQDTAEFELYEGASIFFFPNLLLADNYLKMGRILREMGRESSAHRQWEKALRYIKKSLKTEPTEWGLSVRQETLSLLSSKGTK